MKSRLSTSQSRLFLTFAVLLMSAHGPLSAQSSDGDREYLRTEEIVVIGTASAATLGLSLFLMDPDTTGDAWIPSPLPGDRWLAKTLGGSWSPAKTNWLDHSAGSAFTPALGSVGLIVTNLTWPEGEPWKDAGQDLFLYGSGLVATKGVTGLFKGLVTRPRPFLYLFPGEAVEHVDWDPREARKSFFSGHASSAFFSATYLNKRIRSVMRQRLACNRYDNWKWLPPAIAFSWATYVGWTRIHAYQHYFSDVLAGAVTGFALAELFYWLGDQQNDDNGSAQPQTRLLFQLNFTF